MVPYSPIDVAMGNAALRVHHFGTLVDTPSRVVLSRALAKPWSAQSDNTGPLTLAPVVDERTVDPTRLPMFNACRAAKHPYDQSFVDGPEAVALTAHLTCREHHEVDDVVRRNIELCTQLRFAWRHRPDRCSVTDPSDATERHQRRRRKTKLFGAKQWQTSHATCLHRPLSQR